MKEKKEKLLKNNKYKKIVMKNINLLKITQIIMIFSINIKKIIKIH